MKLKHLLILSAFLLLPMCAGFDVTGSIGFPGGSVTLGRDGKTVTANINLDGKAFIK